MKESNLSISATGKVIISIICTWLASVPTLAQSIPVNFPVLVEYLRRNQVEGKIGIEYSFANRPIDYRVNGVASVIGEITGDDTTSASGSYKQSKNFFMFTPFQNTVGYNSSRPYGWGGGLAKPNVGFQNYASVGVHAKFYFLNVTLQPEVFWAENKSYNGFPVEFTDQVIRERFFYWNHGDFPERFGDGAITRAWWGQSKVSLDFGSLGLALSTQNIWWGPGQFNSLTFSNNAQGFPHISLSTLKPIKTFVGNFEAHIISGRIEDSGISPSQHSLLNDIYFEQFSGDWKYLNALLISYNPKWIPGFFLGLVRTNQQYSEMMENTLADYLPIFNPFQKKNFGFDRDDEGRDQQVKFFSRLLVPSAKAEIYFEYGRRDHALDWRDAVLNPDHARAYLMGFIKLINISGTKNLLQIRAETVHQQESVNRYIRYLGLRGNQTWHTHGRARGFTNHGEALGVGVGVGSNAQILELSLVDGLNKKGLVFERIANNQDFFYRAFGQQSQAKPWIDFGVGFLWDHRWNNLLLSSKLYLVNGYNYQWRLNQSQMIDFGMSNNNLFSTHLRTNLVYFFR